MREDGGGIVRLGGREPEKIKETRKKTGIEVQEEKRTDSREPEKRKERQTEKKNTQKDADRQIYDRQI